MDLESNKFIYSDLNKRKQRMKVTQFMKMLFSN